MKNMQTLIFCLVSVLWAFICGYSVGKSHQEVKYITKEVEIVKQVAKKRAVIHARPHINRDTALELMRAGQL